MNVLDPHCSFVWKLLSLVLYEVASRDVFEWPTPKAAQGQQQEQPFFPPIPFRVSRRSSDLLTEVISAAADVCSKASEWISALLGRQRYLSLNTAAFPRRVYAICCYQWRSLSVLLCRKKG